MNRIDLVSIDWMVADNLQFLLVDTTTDGITYRSNREFELDKFHSLARWEYSVIPIVGFDVNLDRLNRAEWLKLIMDMKYMRQSTTRWWWIEMDIINFKLIFIRHEWLPHHRRHFQQHRNRLNRKRVWNLPDFTLSHNRREDAISASWNNELRARKSFLLVFLIKSRLVHRRVSLYRRAILEYVLASLFGGNRKLTHREEWRIIVRK